MNTSTSARVALLVCAIVTAHVEPSMAEILSDPDSTVVQLSVNDPRPIAKAADELGKHYHLAVSYEDPAYAFAGDVQQVVGMSGKKDVGRQGISVARPVLVPLGGAFEIRVETGPVSDAEAASRLLNRLIEVTADQHNGGRFKVMESAGMLHVVPVAVRSASGEWTPAQSILSIDISMPAGRRSGFETLQTIGDAVAKQSQKPVELGVAPLSFIQASHDYPEQRGSARDVLAAVLASYSKALTWRLLYAPDMERYYLSVIAVPVAQPTKPARPGQSVLPPGGESDAKPGMVKRSRRSQP